MFRPSAPQQGGLDTGFPNNTDGSGRLPVPRGAGMKPRGFTILEILAVISVIAILVGFSIPKFKGMLDEGKVSKAKRELKTFTAAIESYAMHHQRALPSNITTDLVGALPQMIEAVLVDPFAPNGSDTYQYSKNGNYYAIWSVGPNGTNETADITSSGEVPTSGDDYVQTNGTTTALDTETDEANCGSIGTECSGTTDTCTGGTCLCGADPECGAGQSCTDGTCLCGADPECGAGQSCTDGTCACDDGDLTICSGACVDTETDNDNCGECDNACDEGEICTAGVCEVDDPCEDPGATAGTECADGTLYVNATLRTTLSDAGTMQWSTQQIVTGATNTADGAANTATLAGLAGVYPAADYCAALSFGGHEDWYLPAKDELAVLRVNRVALGGDQTNWYWSSTEFNYFNAWRQDFNSGTQNVNGKANDYYVRCVRRTP